MSALGLSGTEVGKTPLAHWLASLANPVPAVESCGDSFKVWSISSEWPTYFFNSL